MGWTMQRDPLLAQGARAASGVMDDWGMDGGSPPSPPTPRVRTGSPEQPESAPEQRIDNPKHPQKWRHCLVFARLGHDLGTNEP